MNPVLEELNNVVRGFAARPAFSALGVGVLASAGTMMRGLSALDHVDLGIDTAHLLSASVVLPTSAHATGADQARLCERLGEPNSQARSCVTA